MCECVCVWGGGGGPGRERERKKERDREPEPDRQKCSLKKLNFVPKTYAFLTVHVRIHNLL